MLWFGPVCVFCVRAHTLCACSAGLGQIRQICCGHAVLDLGVGDGTMLLSQVQPKLALMAKVQVAFLTLQNKHKTFVKTSSGICITLHVCKAVSLWLKCFSLYSHGKVFLLCVCADDS